MLTFHRQSSGKQWRRGEKTEKKKKEGGMEKKRPEKGKKGQGVWRREGDTEKRHGKNKRTAWNDSGRVQALIQHLLTWHTAHGEQALH